MLARLNFVISLIYKIMASPIEVQSYLSGISFPSSKEDLIAHAKEKGASQDVLSTLESLPDMEYGDASDVSSALAGEGEDDTLEEADVE